MSSSRRSPRKNPTPQKHEKQPVHNPFCAARCIPFWAICVQVKEEPPDTSAFSAHNVKPTSNILPCDDNATVAPETSFPAVVSHSHNETDDKGSPTKTFQLINIPSSSSSDMFMSPSSSSPCLHSSGILESKSEDSSTQKQDKGKSKGESIISCMDTEQYEHEVGIAVKATVPLENLSQKTTLGTRSITPNSEVDVEVTSGDINEPFIKHTEFEVKKRLKGEDKGADNPFESSRLEVLPTSGESTEPSNVVDTGMSRKTIEEKNGRNSNTSKALFSEKKTIFALNTSTESRDTPEPIKTVKRNATCPKVKYIKKKGLRSSPKKSSERVNKMESKAPSAGYVTPKKDKGNYCESSSSNSCEPAATVLVKLTPSKWATKRTPSKQSTETKTLSYGETVLKCTPSDKKNKMTPSQKTSNKASFGNVGKSMRSLGKKMNTLHGKAKATIRRSIRGKKKCKDNSSTKSRVIPPRIAQSKARKQQTDGQKNSCMFKCLPPLVSSPTEKQSEKTPSPFSCLRNTVLAAAETSPSPSSQGTGDTEITASESISCAQTTNSNLSCASTEFHLALLPKVIQSKAKQEPRDVRTDSGGFDSLLPVKSHTENKNEKKTPSPFSSLRNTVMATAKASPSPSKQKNVDANTTLSESMSCAQTTNSNLSSSSTEFELALSKPEISPRRPLNKNSKRVNSDQKQTPKKKRRVETVLLWAKNIKDQHKVVAPDQVLTALSDSSWDISAPSEVGAGDAPATPSKNKKMHKLTPPKILKKSNSGEKLASVRKVEPEKSYSLLNQSSASSLHTTLAADLTLTSSSDQTFGKGETPMKETMICSPATPRFFTITPGKSATKKLCVMDEFRILQEELTSLNKDSNHLSPSSSKFTPKRQSAISRTPKSKQSTPVRSPLPLLSPSLSHHNYNSRSPTRASVKRRLHTSPGKGSASKPEVKRLRRSSRSKKISRRKSSSPLSSERQKEKKRKFTDGSDDSWSSDDSGALKILSSEDDTVDAILEEKAKKFNLKLSAKNVKSLLHEVITNEHVLDMVRNTLHNEDGLEDQLKEAIFEPKMTRSKVKEVIGKGALAPHWPLSPIKGPPKPKKPQFLELAFSDNEEGDDEYEPTKDELEKAELEEFEDDESVISSTFGSPLPSNPNTPCTPQSVTSQSEGESTPKTSSSLGDIFKRGFNNKAKDLFNETPFLESTPKFASAQRNLSEELQDATFITPACPPSVTEKEGDETIALRTRSKLPLKDTRLAEIESNFVDPDNSDDLYDMSKLYDNDWQNFLSELMTEPTQDVNSSMVDDDPNDPEYNFLSEAEAEDDIEDKFDEFRDDRAVKIPKRELNELMEELFEAYNVAGNPVLNESGDSTNCSVLSGAVDANLDEAAPAASEEQTEESEPSDNCPREENAEKPSSSGSPEKDEDLVVQSVKIGTRSKGLTVKFDPDINTEDSNLGPETPNAGGRQYPGHIPPLRLDEGLATVFMSDLLRITGREIKPYVTENEGVNTVKAQDEQILMLTDGERIQLQDQMRKHVQLLIQTNIQASHDSELAGVANTAKFYLRELKTLGDNSIVPAGRTSAFYAVNLHGAIELANVKYNDESNEKKNEILQNTFARKCDVVKGTKLLKLMLSYERMEIFAGSPVFIFPQMLPEVKFVQDKKERRVNFTEAEDVLLAMGLKQYSLVSGKKFIWIKKNLLPCKTTSQLQTRLKNLRGPREIHRNVVKEYVQTLQLPDFPRYLELEDPSEIVAPKDRDPSLMPEWWEAYEISRRQIEARTKLDRYQVKLETFQETASPNDMSIAGELPDIASNDGVSSLKHSKTPQLYRMDTGSDGVTPCSPLEQVSSFMTASSLVTENTVYSSTTTPVCSTVALRMPPMGLQVVHSAGGTEMNPVNRALSDNLSLLPHSGSQPSSPASTISIASPAMLHPGPAVSVSSAVNSPALSTSPNLETPTQIVVDNTQVLQTADKSTAVILTTEQLQQIGIHLQVSGETNDLPTPCSTTSVTTSEPEPLIGQPRLLTPDMVSEPEPLIGQPRVLMNHPGISARSSAVKAAARTSSIATSAPSVLLSMPSIAGYGGEESEPPDMLDSGGKPICTMSNIISHAFSEAMGISMQELNSGQNISSPVKRPSTVVVAAPANIPSGDFVVPTSMKTTEIPQITLAETSRVQLTEAPQVTQSEISQATQSEMSQVSRPEMSGFTQVPSVSATDATPAQISMPNNCQLSSVSAPNSDVIQVSCVASPNISAVKVSCMTTSNMDSMQVTSLLNSSVSNVEISAGPTSNVDYVQSADVPTSSPVSNSNMVSKNVDVVQTSSLPAPNREILAAAENQKKTLPVQMMKQTDELASSLTSTPSRSCFKNQSVALLETSPVQQRSPAPMLGSPVPVCTPKQSHTWPPASMESPAPSTPHKLAATPGSSVDQDSVCLTDMDLDFTTDASMSEHDANTSREFNINDSVMTPEKIPNFSIFGREVTPPNPDKPPQKSSQQTPKKPAQTPMKKAIEIMAQMAQTITPKKKTPVKTCSPPIPVAQPSRKCKSVLFSSQRGKSPTRSPIKILPKPLSSLSPVKTVSPRIKPRKSPRKKLLQQRAREILPKGFVLTSYISPVKKVAASLSARAKKSRLGGAHLNLRSRLQDAGDEHSDVEGHDMSEGTTDYDTVDSDLISEDNLEPTPVEENIVSGGVKKKASSSGVKQKRKRRRYTADKDDNPNFFSPSENEDSNGASFPPEYLRDSQEEGDEPDHVTANTGFPTKRGSSRRGKSKQKKDGLLALLAPDLLEGDPLRDERDTAYAQSYLQRAREALSQDEKQYQNFLQLLSEFGTSDRTPVELYADMMKLLKDHPDLMEDFSGFLLPDQAKECGCLLSNLTFNRARAFFRKIEVHFQKQPTQLAKILKVFSLWQNDPTLTSVYLKESLCPLLKGQQHLLDEFTLFFDEDKPPDSALTEYEDVCLEDIEADENYEWDGFEQVDLPDQAEDQYRGTPWCRCHCHNTRDQHLSNRRKHCMVCGLNIIKGALYLRSAKNLRPINIVIHQDQSSQNSGLATSPLPNGDVDMLGLADGPQLADDEASNTHDGIKESDNYEGVKENIHPPKLKNKRTTKPKDKTTKSSRLKEDTGARVNSTISAVNEDSMFVGDKSSGFTATQSSQGPTDFSILRQEISKSNDVVVNQTECCDGDENISDVDTLITTSSTKEGDISKDTVDDGSSSDTDTTVVETGSLNNTLEASPSDKNRSQIGLSEVMSNVSQPEEKSEQTNAESIQSEALCSVNDHIAITSDHNDDLPSSNSTKTSEIKSGKESADVMSKTVNEEAPSVKTDAKDDENTQAPEQSQPSPDVENGSVAIPREAKTSESWTHTEDKLILDTCKSEGVGQETFVHLSIALKNRTAEEVSGRFSDLMQLLEELSEDETEPEVTDAED